MIRFLDTFLIVIFSSFLVIFYHCASSGITISRIHASSDLENYTKNELNIQDGINDIEVIDFPYIPDTADSTLPHLKILRVNIHFMNSSDSSRNYIGKEAELFAHNLILHSNQKLKENAKMLLPEKNNTEIISAGYQYQISEIDGDKGIYYHFDDAHYYYINKGKKRNNYSPKLIDKYAFGMDSIINIFLLTHHPDSLKSLSYNASHKGIALGNAVKIVIRYDNKESFWRYGGLLNHEIGHILGLRHSWNENDGCDDTPKNPNCWNKSDNPPCDRFASNNMMDYNVSQAAITPCQLNRVHKNLSQLHVRARKNLVKTWCEVKELKDYIITDRVIWNFDRDLLTNVYLKNGARLIINCRVSMPENSYIAIEPNASLILEDAVLHNDCGKNWQGILIQTRNRKIDTQFKTTANTRIYDAASAAVD